MNASPKSAVFYSTNRGFWGWGAPDYVWPHAARRLLERGIPVVAVLHPDALRRPEVQTLCEQGARIFVQPPPDRFRGRLAALRRWRRKSSRPFRQLHTCLESLERPHFFINQGGTHDILDEEFLQPWITQDQSSYDLFCHSNRAAPPFSQSARSLATRAFARARHCYFNSLWMRELTETQLVRHLDNAANFPLSIRFPCEAALGWPTPDTNHTLRLAAVNRMDAHHKGLDVLLQALARLPADLPPWIFDFYGDGPDTDYLRDLSQWLNLDVRVRFHSHATDIPAIWKDHHLLVLTSRYEGLAVSMLEAMACGRPVLRTPYGGSHEWVVPHETGFICPAPEPDLIAQTLARAMQARAQWPAMGLAAFERVRQRLPRDPWQLYLEPFETPRNSPA